MRTTRSRIARIGRWAIPLIPLCVGIAIAWYIAHWHQLMPDSCSVSICGVGLYDELVLLQVERHLLMALPVIAFTAISAWSIYDLGLTSQFVASTAGLYVAKRLGYAKQDSLQLAYRLKDYLRRITLCLGVLSAIGVIAALVIALIAPLT